MFMGASTRLSECLGVELAGRLGDNRQYRTSNTLPTNIEDRANLAYVRQLLEIFHKASELRKSWLVKDVTLRAVEANNAITIGCTEAIPNGIDKSKFLVNKLGVRGTEQTCWTNTAK
jgi:hypothetical protein